MSTICGEEVTEAQMIKKTLRFSRLECALIATILVFKILLTCKLSLVVEQNKKVLIKNYNSKPTSFEAIPEPNANFG